MRRALFATVSTATLILIVDAVRNWRWPGWRQGMRYRLHRCHPDPDVDDRTLADRIRSTIGPVERRLDLPHIHVMVEDHVALLHGEVASRADAVIVERAVRRVVGVRGIESYLHVGLLPSDSRPSRGRSEQPAPSAAKRRLLAAARRGGADDAHAAAAVRAVLAVFLERLPGGEREHVLSHLPADVRRLTVPPIRSGASVAPVRTVTDFVAAVVAEGGDPGGANPIVREVVGELRRLVPEENADIAAVLPRELRSFWTASSGITQEGDSQWQTPLAAHP